MSYLDDSPWTRITESIATLVDQLDRDPIRLYEFVLNTCRTEFYYGAMQGAAATLNRRSGNDYDQVALLMALYHAADIPCRFIRGVVEIPLAAAINWTGIQDPQSVERFFLKAGIPIRPHYTGGAIVSFEVGENGDRLIFLDIS